MSKNIHLELKQWKCMDCGMTFIPTYFPPPADYSCPKCGSLDTATVEDIRKREKENEERARMFDCAFQRKFPHREDMRCALTAIGEYGGVMGTFLANYDACHIEICPLYQT